MDNHSASLAVMRKTRALFAALVLAAMTVAAHAQMGPQTGDKCSQWVICPDGGASWGVYPGCFCGAPPERTEPTEPTCESQSSSCSPGEVSSGTWPDCSCSPPPSCTCNLGELPSGTWPDCFCTREPPPPPPECGRCEVQMGQQCIPITCKD